MSGGDAERVPPCGQCVEGKQFSQNLEDHSSHCTVCSADFYNDLQHPQRPSGYQKCINPGVQLLRH